MNGTKQEKKQNSAHEKFDKKNSMRCASSAVITISLRQKGCDKDMYETNNLCM